ncbi:hypothetical protein AB0K40_15730 [Nonomuraea bangladeshensis]|uniref:Helix-turn-helix transcriptional regulator n=1 Tax=Nonomuraea bangladeshensis TaxID=404385 RepID=A0ABV3H339_9ACTN
MATELPAWAVRLRAERRNRFWSQKEMARHLVEAAGDDVRARLPSRESIVRRIKAYEAGHNQPDDPYRLLYARAFGLAENDLFEPERRPVPTVTAAPDPELYERITKALAHPQRVDTATIEWVERCLEEHRRAEDTMGSGPLLPVVRAQLDAVTVLAQGTPGPLAGRVAGLLGQYAQFVAWMCQDSGELIRAAGEHPEDEPPWMYFYDDGWFDMQRGMAELALGDGRRAVRFLDRGLATLPSAYRRDRAWLGRMPWPAMWRPPKSSRSRWLPTRWRSTATPPATCAFWLPRCTPSVRRAGSAFTLP